MIFIEIPQHQRLDRLFNVRSMCSLCVTICQKDFIVAAIFIFFSKPQTKAEQGMAQNIQTEWALCILQLNWGLSEFHFDISNSFSIAWLGNDDTF